MPISEVDLQNLIQQRRKLIIPLSSPLPAILITTNRKPTQPPLKLLRQVSHSRCGANDMKIYSVSQCLLEGSSPNASFWIRQISEDCQLHSAQSTTQTGVLANSTVRFLTSHTNVWTWLSARTLIFSYTQASWIMFAKIWVIIPHGGSVRLSDLDMQFTMASWCRITPSSSEQAGAENINDFSEVAEEMSTFRHLKV